MATYQKNGLRKFKLEHNKNVLKQIENFHVIIKNMELLDKYINDYPEVITENTLQAIAKLINLEKKLKLTDDQINMVTKNYGENKL